ncbi:nitrogenase iron-molybdenum cofactor biosynthesis protein NifN [Zoogloea sp.]|uniref:nitrogenase iron-molybdenum cofactor biosynthesis protein NifN n=1 Tax=Zoogloea sp. TaxID=49181 RepID=UPI001416A9AC|nr:MAG: nitrogenase iron-molybdenum cofactor biosynthesis protein NifN [Zoogloea sp.]
MASVRESKKACAVNPLKMSQPLGACYAFLGLSNTMPMMHGSQGCTSFGLVLLVRHFKEAIPMQTTAMNEVSTILGGMDNIEQALLNIKKRANPALIAIASTGLTETKGDDVDGYLRLIRAKHGETLAGTEVVYVSTPDYVGAFQDGWAAAVKALVDAFSEPVTQRVAGRVGVLPGAHLTPADLEELRELIEAFGLQAVMVPDISGSLDGHIPEDFTPTTLGGATLDDIRGLAACQHVIAVGEQMRPALDSLAARSGVPVTLFERLSGLTAVDALVALLMRLSGRPAPARLKRQRGQLQDAMLDGHFHLGGKRVAIGAEPDLLFALASVTCEMGAEVAAAVTTTHSPVLEKVPAVEVLIGDLEDLELGAVGCDLLLTHAHGRQAATRLGIPLFRVGIPQFDRIGAAHQLTIGYRGTRDLIFQLANTFIANMHAHGPEDWPLPAEAVAAARGGTAGACNSGGSCSCSGVTEDIVVPIIPAR